VSIFSIAPLSATWTILDTTFLTRREALARFYRSECLTILAEDQGLGGMVVSGITMTNPWLTNFSWANEIDISFALVVVCGQPLLRAHQPILWNWIDRPRLVQRRHLKTFLLTLAQLIILFA
jgi:hypothetical protein